MLFVKNLFNFHSWRRIHAAIGFVISIVILPVQAIPSGLQVCQGGYRRSGEI